MPSLSMWEMTFDSNGDRINEEVDRVIEVWHSQPNVVNVARRQVVLIVGHVTLVWEDAR